TIGGNDIGFANLIYQCTVADCSATLDSTRVNLENTLAPALHLVYSTVKSDAPNAKIIVLRYPRGFSGSSRLRTLGITPTEQMKANALADELNQVIAKYASSNQVTYESAIGPFLGHAVCSFSPYLNGLNLFNTGESYHPTRSGQSSGYLPLVAAGLTG